MYVCVSVRSAYACMHVWTDACLYGCMFVCMHARMYVFVCMYVGRYVCMQTCVYACVHVWMCVCTYKLACTHVCMCVCPSMCAHPCMYVCMYVYLRKPLVLQPLSELLDIEHGKTVDQFRAARPTMVRVAETGIVDLDKIWSEGMRRLTCVRTKRKPWDELSTLVCFMIVTFQDTGVIEQDFQHVQAYSSGRKANIDDKMLNSLMKVRLDGPPPDQYVRCERIGASNIYTPSALCLRVQRIYYSKHWGLLKTCYEICL
jgi:hypothetical protein